MVVSPTATVASRGNPGGGGFTDGAGTGTVAFHDLAQCNYTKMYHSGVPTAFVDSGRSGPTPWAGGGGAGPKGNEASGSYTADPPVYAARGNWFNNADAWVDSGGTVDVKRSYVTSNAGDGAATSVHGRPATRSDTRSAFGRCASDPSPPATAAPRGPGARPGSRLSNNNESSPITSPS